MKKLDALLIGYKKVGTTLLRDFFEQHPSISWSRNGGYFLLNNSDYEKRRDEYLEKISLLNNKINIDMFEQLSIATIKEKPDVNKFSINETLDYNNLYSSKEEVANRIFNTLENTKIIITIREQLDWISSYYLHHMITLDPKYRSFQDFLKTPEGKCVLSAGYYNETIKVYQKVFGKENVFVLPLEEIKNNFNDAFNRLAKFLEVESIEFLKSSAETNKGIGSLNGKFVSMASKIGISDSMMKRIKPLYTAIKPLLLNKKNKNILNGTEQNMIKAFYATSNLETQKLLDKDLKGLGYYI